MRVTVFHNTGHVRNSLDSYIPSMDGFDPRGLLTEVTGYDVEIATPEDLTTTLTFAFQTLNVGDDPAFGTPTTLAVEYRARRNRSLSVGDVVRVGETFYAVERFGWAEVEVLPGQITERTRYGSTHVDLPVAEIQSAVDMDDLVTSADDAEAARIAARLARA